MSHHFDVRRAKTDPSLNICDAYLFKDGPGHTVMAMTVNADAGIGSPDFIPSEALYAFRFDLNGDPRGRRRDRRRRRRLEVPNELIVKGKVRLYGHAPEVQICRWGLPLFTHLFLSDAVSTAAAEKYHASVPADDVQQFAGKIRAEFPYYGSPYTKEEQSDLAAISTGFSSKGDLSQD
jgi:hypothetical protein